MSAKRCQVHYFQCLQDGNTHKSLAHVTEVDGFIPGNDPLLHVAPAFYSCPHIPSLPSAVISDKDRKAQK